MYHIVAKIGCNFLASPGSANELKDTAAKDQWDESYSPRSERSRQSVGSIVGSNGVGHSKSQYIDREGYRFKSVKHSEIVFMCVGVIKSISLYLTTIKI